MRLSRSLWFSWFVKYDEDWKEHPVSGNERIVDELIGKALVFFEPCFCISIKHPLRRTLVRSVHCAAE